MGDSNTAGMTNDVNGPSVLWKSATHEAYCRL